MYQCFVGRVNICIKHWSYLVCSDVRVWRWWAQ